MASAGGATRDGAKSSDAGARSRPFALKIRSSVPFITLTAGMSILTDIGLYGLVTPILPYRLESLGVPDEQIGRKVGLLIGAYAAGLVLSSIPVGVLGELYPGRRLPLLFGCGLALGGVALFALGQTFAAMLVARVLQGVGGTIVWTLSLAMISDSVTAERRTTMFGYAMAGATVGNFIGPAAGGALYSLGGWHAPFIFAAALLVIDMALRLLVIETSDAAKHGYTPPWAIDRSEERAQEHSHAATLRALRQLMRSARFWTISYVTFVTGAVIAALIDTGLTLRLRSSYGFDSLRAGLTILAAVGPTILVLPFAGHLIDSKFGPRRVGIVALILACASTAALSIRGIAFGIFLALLMVQCSFASILEPAMSTDLSSLVESGPDALGFAHVFALSNLAFSTGTLVGPVVAGPLLDKHGVQQGFAVSAIIGAGLFAVGILPWARYVERRSPALEGEREPLLPQSQ